MTRSQLKRFILNLLKPERDQAPPWGGMDPNSEHQRWSQWMFIIYDLRSKRPPYEDVKKNAHRFFQQLFGKDSGRMRVTEEVTSWHIELQVEGVDAHDPVLVAAVRKQFQRDFVQKGWGSLAHSEVHVKMLAGSPEDGSPAKQLIVAGG